MSTSRKTEKGYVALFAVLVASIILSMALGIANISLKELNFTATAKESSFAFFAADTGSECALYSDRDLMLFEGNPPSVTMNCRDQNLLGNSASLSPFEGGGVIYTFPALTLDRGCVLVTVVKDNEIDPNDSNILGTRVTAKGYNTSCTQVANNPKPPSLVERVLEYTYANESATGGGGTGATAQQATSNNN